MVHYFLYFIPMANKSILLTALFAVTLLSGCELIGDIFQAGIYVGIFLIIVVVVLVYWVFSFFRRRF